MLEVIKYLESPFDYDEDSYEIGWVIDRNYWGLGYASELTQMLIEKSRGNKKV